MRSIWHDTMTGGAALMHVASCRKAVDAYPRLLGPVANAFILGLIATSTLIAAEFSSVVMAQTYPTRPITMVVPAPAGGPTDAIARVLTEQMRGSLGRPIIIENITGGGGTIGTGRVARATPDGYTIDLGFISQHVLNGAFYSLSYDVLRDFAPISPVVTSPQLLFARKTLPAKDLNGFIAWLKANPDKASAGVAGSTGNLTTAFFQKQTGTKFTFVPYRGVAPAVQDLVAGQIDFSLVTPDPLPLVGAGHIKAYAVTSDKRLALAPDVPTFAEMGWPAMSWSSWYGLFAPNGTPKEIIDRVNAAIVAALADPAVRSRLVDIGVETFPREQQTPEALGALVKADAEKWWPIIKQLGIKIDP
jgi:tripartite-type tricarboxylate transporter receptor subunit TctC